jgi:hypothetical protein
VYYSSLSATAATVHPFDHRSRIDKVTPHTTFIQTTQPYYKYNRLSRVKAVYSDFRPGLLQATKPVAQAAQQIGLDWPFSFACPPLKLFSRTYSNARLADFARIFWGIFAESPPLLD